MTTPAASVAAHYGRLDLLDAIDAALEAAGIPRDRLRAEDLAPLDQFHTRGLEATLDLARLAGIAGTDRVLDVGGGLGGPARTLASSVGCRVTVLDLTPEFCSAGEELTRRVGLADWVDFRVGNALDLPFPVAGFDVVWMQHCNMNIADKPRLFAEARRMLRPGGRLAIHEIAAGASGPVVFPVPWASRAELSFLSPDTELRATVREAGFRERTWVDLTEPSLAWVEARLAAGPPGPLGLQVLLGEGMRVALGNVRNGLAEGRLRVIEAVFE